MSAIYTPPARANRPPEPRKPGRKLARLALGAIALLAGIAVVLYLVARFVVWPNIDTVVARYAGAVEARLGTSLSWKSIHSEWTGLRPSIEFIEPSLGSGELATRAARVSATISLRALLRGQPQLHDLVVDRPVVPLRRSGDTITLAILGAQRDQPAPSSGVAQWLLQQPDVRVGGATLLVADAEDPRRNLQLDQVNLVLKSSGRHHDARLDVGQADALAASLVAHLDATRSETADPADWRTWAGSVQLEGRQLSPQLLLLQLPVAAQAVVQERLSGVVAGSLSGRVDPSVSLELEAGRVVDARIRLRADDFSLMLADAGADTANTAANTAANAATNTGAGSLRFSRINADLRVRQGADGTTEISASALELEEVGGARLLATLPQPVLRLSADGGAIERFGGGFERIDIGPVLGLARLLADEPAAGGFSEAIHRLSGSGALNGVDVAWQRAAAGPSPWRVRASFERASLAVAPTEFQVSHPRAIRIPDIQNLSGAFEATESGGKAAFRTPAPGAAEAPDVRPASLVRLAGLLVEPEVPLSSLDSQFSWKVDRSAGAAWLAVQADRLVFANGDASASATGRYQTGGRGAGTLDLRARIGTLQANRIWRYLPHEVPEPVRGWIRGAFEAGVLEGGEARWRGDIRDFPYRLKSPQEDPGEFRVTAKARDLLVKYSPDWPVIHGVAGAIEFNRAGMDLQVERASILDVPVTGATVRMEDVATGRLEIAARAQGDMAQMLKFVNTSPLANAVGAATRPMVAKGPGALEVRLDLPLRDLQAATARGHIDLAGAGLALESAHVKLDDLKGRLEFTGKSLAFERVRGSLSGMPIEVSGQTGEPGTMRLQARGTMTAEGLRGIGGEPLTRHLRGASPYTAEADISREGTRLSIQSDLVGLGSGLPAPLSKEVDASWPFRLTMTPQAPPGGPGRAAESADRIEASLGKEVVLLVERSRADARRPMQLARGTLAVNRQPDLPEQGLSFQFTGRRIDLDAWRQVLTPTAAGGGPEGPSLLSTAALPLAVSLVSEEVRVADRNLGKVVLGATRAGSQWQVNLSARELNGFLTWSDIAGTPGALTARFGRLEIPESQRQEIATALSTGPTSLPAMDISAERFILGGIDFGALHLVARNATLAAAQPGARRSLSRPRVWQLERLRLVRPAAVLEAKGQWDGSTSLTYQWDITDAGGFLEGLQLKGAVRGGAGTLSGELHWRGSPFAMDLPSLGGTVDIAIRDGQFLKVEPGAAKLIGVLNLQALPKLLTLDFRDIFAQGFSFNELRGNVVILDGIASTDSLAMRGLQAVVQIKGDVDLQASTQKLRVVVIPELNGGLATLAYAAIVNPAIGLGAFVAQSIFSQPLSRALAHEIDITGSWSDPLVVERKRERFHAPVGQ